MNLDTGISHQSRKGRVLIVDDEPQIRALARRILETDGYDVVDVGRVDDALQVMTADPALDVIFSDINMPGLNGMDLASFVLRERPELPLVFMTAIDRHSILHKALESHSRFVYKPFTRQDLCSAVVDVVRPAAT
jgi:CheY-like chemotaxis protein